MVVVPGPRHAYGDRNGGPEQSLTLWGDPGRCVLCDYGASEVMIHTFAERYGRGFVRDLLFEGGGSVTVDPADPTLSFDARRDIEPGYDIGAVRASTDGGATFTSRRSAGMVTALASDAEQNVAALLPGFNGDSGGWTHQGIDLSDLAGRTVPVAFRYKTDFPAGHPGLWVDDIRSGGTLVSDGTGSPSAERSRRAGADRRGPGEQLLPLARPPLPPLSVPEMLSRGRTRCPRRPASRCRTRRSRRRSARSRTSRRARPAGPARPRAWPGAPRPRDPWRPVRRGAPGS